MIRRGQVFVRAQDETGKWGNADALDLSQESLNAFLLGVLVRLGLLVVVRDEHAEGEPVKLTTRPGFRFED